MACDEAAVVELCRANGLAALKAIRPDIETIVEEADRYDPDIPYEVRRARSVRRGDSGVPLGEDGGAGGGRIRPSRHATRPRSPGGSPRRDRTQVAPEVGAASPGQHVGVRLAAVLPPRRPGRMCERPDDPRYVDQMIASTPALETLRSDPSLRDEVWAFFETDTRGLLLHRRWTEVLVQLVEDGLLDREQLVDAALGALTMQAPWPRLTWFASFVEALDPTGEIIRRQLDACLALMRSTVPQVVAIAQRVLGPQLISGELRPEPFLDVAASPLQLKDKGVAIAELKLLQSLAADPAWVSPVLDVVSHGFGHRHRDVQELALRIVQPRLDDADADTRRTVEERYELLPPSVRPIHAAPPPATEPVAVRSVTADHDGPLGDDQFVEALASLMERQAPPLDRVIEAAYRVCGYPLEHRVEMMRPLLPRTRPSFVWDACARVREPMCASDGRRARRRPQRSAGCRRAALERGCRHRRIREVEAVPRNADAPERSHRPRRSRPPTRSGVRRRRAGRGLRGQAPSRQRSAVDRPVRADLRHHQGLALRQEDRPHRDDRLAGPALHCSPPSPFEHSSSWTSTHADPDTREPVTTSGERTWVSPDRPIVLGDAGSIDVFHYLWQGFHLDDRLTPWWLSLFPGYIDLGGIMSLASFNDVMDLEPSMARPNLLTPMLERYASHPPTVFGDVDAVVLACGLAAKPLSCRLAALDAMVAAGDDHHRVVAHRPLGRAPRRGAGTEARTPCRRARGAAAQVADARSRLRTSPARTGLDHREAHRVLALTEDAFTLCGSAPLPEPVHQLATSWARASR